MKQVIIITTLAIIAAFSFTGCFEEIDYDLNNEGFQRLVVDAWIQDRAMPHTVKLSLTTSYFEDEDSPNVTGAVVKLSDGTNEVSLTETAPGIYQTDSTYAGQVGLTYTLTIDYEGESYTASSYLAPVTPIDSLDYEFAYVNEDDNEDAYHLLLYTQEPAGLGDYYYLNVLVNGENRTDSLSLTAFESDEFVDGSYFAGIEVDLAGIYAGQEATLELFSISEEAYNFFLEVMLETQWNSGIFAAPPANVKGNISNGAIGIFYASSVSTASIVVEP